jgi:hypothetical protein
VVARIGCAGGGRAECEPQVSVRPAVVFEMCWVWGFAQLISGHVLGCYDPLFCILLDLLWCAAPPSPCFSHHTSSGSAVSQANQAPARPSHGTHAALLSVRMSVACSSSSSSAAPAWRLPHKICCLGTTAIASKHAQLGPREQQGEYQ